MKIFLLQAQQYLAILPQIFKVVKFTLIRGEQMYNDIAIVNNQPAIAGDALFFAFLSMGAVDVVDCGVGQCVQHTVTGTRTQDEIVCEGYNVFQVDQDDIFSLFIFQGVYDFTGKFKSVQGSPHGLDNGAEKSFV